MTKKTLTLMQGIPGSGKSTVAKALADATGALIFSTDEFWYMGDPSYYDYDKTRTAEAHNWNQRRAILEMSRNMHNIIIDNTNLTQEAVSPYLMGAYVFGYDTQVIRVDVPLEVAFARNATRPKDRQIPESVIEEMAERMQLL
jgi:predicted kinase